MANSFTLESLLSLGGGGFYSSILTHDGRKGKESGWVSTYKTRNKGPSNTHEVEESCKCDGEVGALFGVSADTIPDFSSSQITTCTCRFSLGNEVDVIYKGKNF